jgi:tRNA dimethylallyltransferase
MKKPVVFIVGPTAVGKTTLSLAIANRFDGEIISGDSMQVYRGMDIGTAKASAEEMAQIPHHLINIRNPEDAFTVSDFQQLASEAISDIHARGKLPIVVGGTGLYVESLCYQFQFGEGAPDEAMRANLQARLDSEGNEALYAELKQIDENAAAKIHPNDSRRIIRALEVWYKTGTKISEASVRKESAYDPIWIGLTMNRALLYARIEERIDLMLAAGLVDEVKRIISLDIPSQSTSLQAIGYKELIKWLEGEYDYERAVELLKRDTRHFAKRQLSWFRRMPEIQWFDCTEPKEMIVHFSGISDIIEKAFKTIQFRE